LHIYEWDAWAQKTVPTPLVIGHEFVGTVVEIGKNVKGVKVGDRVSGEGHLTCGTCRRCRQGQRHLCPNTRGLGYHCQGCFAEYLNLPEENVFPIPETISDDLAAIFDPFGNAVHTTLSFNLVGEDVLITGAGPIGIMAVAIAKKAGARHIVITDVNEYRLSLARKMGATLAVNVGKTTVKEALKEAGLEAHFYVGLEMSGHPLGLNTLLQELDMGGQIALLGILPPDVAIDWNLVIFKLLHIKGIWGREIFNTWYQMSHLLESGLDISSVITHRFPVDDFEKGFEVMRSGLSGKVILEW
jgi:threonine 3-dehydrogenase